MTERGSRPKWVMRQMRRRAARYADDRVIRWIALPARWGRRHGPPQPSVEGETVLDVDAHRAPDADGS